MTGIDDTLAAVDDMLATESLHRALGGDLSADQLADGTHRLLTAIEAETPRPVLPRTWCLHAIPTYRWPIIPDYTSHSRGWPYVCEDRGELPVDDGATVTLVCTRRADHTGRHAHGSGALVEAVWEDA